MVELDQLLRDGGEPLALAALALGRLVAVEHVDLAHVRQDPQDDRAFRLLSVEKGSILVEDSITLLPLLS